MIILVGGVATSGRNKMWKNDNKVLPESQGGQTSGIWLFPGQAPRGWKGTSSLPNSASGEWQEDRGVQDELG